MKQILIKENDAGQRLDRLLGRYLKEAPKSFLYRMLRKKNIILNGKKADGSERLSPGDEITVTGICQNGWIRIPYNGGTAYIWQDFVSW